MKSLAARSPLSRDSILSAIEIVALLATLPFVVWDFMQSKFKCPQKTI
jgi:hypothetical protein